MSNELDTQESIDLRQKMVADQLFHRGIRNESILQAFQTIPRHLFIPHVRIDEAYSDRPIPIKAGQTISQPYVVALMLTYLDVKSHHRILEIGSGSGYSTAIISSLCQHITGIEVFQELLEGAQQALVDLKIENVSLKHASAWEQFEQDIVYDRIILWASPPKIPTHLFGRMDEDSVLVAPQGKREQFVWKFKKNEGKIERVRLDPVRFVPLVQGSVQEIDINR